MYSRRPQRLVSAALHHRLSRLCLFQFSLQLSAVLPRRSSAPLTQPTHPLYASLAHTHAHTHARVQYLHPEEGDAGQEVNSGLEILETLWVSGWEIILEEDIERGK